MAVRTAVSCLLFGLLVPGPARALDLVSDGRPQATLVLPDKPLPKRNDTLAAAIRRARAGRSRRREGREREEGIRASVSASPSGEARSEA